MSNLWKRFQQLIPRTNLIIVTVVSNNGNGTSTVQNAQGQQYLVRGEEFIPTTKVFISDGGMDGQAPTLTQQDYEV